MLRNLVINALLYILSFIPYKNKWGLSLGTILKDRYYRKHRGEYCLCGGKLTLHKFYNGQALFCSKCWFLADED